MARRALGKDAKIHHNSKASSTAKKRRKDNVTDNTGNEVDGKPEDDAGDDQAYLRGGILRAGELKALTSGVKDLEEFKKLGEGVLSPTSPDGKDMKFEDGDRMSREKLKVVYTSEDEMQLAEIASKKTILRQRREALGDREKFLNLVKSRAKSVLEELKKKDGMKDVCGFDSRLSWSDEEFEAWRVSTEGKKALDSGTLEAPMVKVGEEDDDEVVNGDTSHAEEIGKGVCQKKRCERHKQWFKLKVQEIGFEKDECRQAMRKLEAEEKGLRERAMVRHLEGGEEDEDTTTGDVEMS
jgi:COMPASS component SPP1